MKIRSLTSAIILAVMVPVLIFSKYLIYPIALAIFAVAAVFELLRVIGVHKNYKISIPAYIMAAALPVLTHDIFLDQNPELQKNYMLFAVATVFTYMLYIMALAVFSDGELRFSKIAEVFLAVTYVVMSFTALCLLRYIRNGTWCFFLVFLSAWGTDVGAYCVGSLIGKHKLLPKVSPKKSIEGAVGGTVFAILLFMLYGFAVSKFTELTPNYLLLGIDGVVLSVISQIGDLIASLIKREYGVKDYGKILPGHGGIMDRFDSILAVSLPLVMMCLWMSPFN
jgi:phosphatidate cytidylyltransferase